MNYKKMKGKMCVYCDEEGDYLKIRVGEPRENYGEELNQNITLFKDEKTNGVVGIGILNFKDRTNLNNLEIDLPLDISFFTKKYKKHFYFV